MKKKISILTNFTDFHPGYSLTGIVKDQCRMLTEHGHDVCVVVSEQFNDESRGEKFFRELGVEVFPALPQPDLVDYRSEKEISEEHKADVKKISHVLKNILPGSDFVFTHDFVFTGWNLPYALALMESGRELRREGHLIKYLHWIHSLPAQGFDWWNLKRYGPGHKLIYPNKTDALRVATAYQCKVADVKVIPHIKDLRSFMEFDPETDLLIKNYPGLMQSDIVQIYPVGSDRLKAKHLRDVIILFRAFKKMGFSVCLCVCNSWATGREPMQDVEHFERIAMRNGLTRQEFFFTSRFSEKYKTGVPIRMVRELLMCSNVMIYPTQEESFGLIGLEAALAGGCLVVLNKSLDMMLEVHGFSSLFVNFGSFEVKPKHAVSEREYFDLVAALIVGRMRENESINCKTFHRQFHNWDYIYNRHYLPIFGDSETWG
jgi:glycosyltransferase involved in cell wall biosynthesis